MPTHIKEYIPVFAGSIPAAPMLRIDENRRAIDLSALAPSAPRGYTTGLGGSLNIHV
jgi:hypothetical protein